MGGQVTSNPNNDNRQPVYYNGRTYIPESDGSRTFIRVGNHIVTVNLNDPTWFQQQVSGNGADKSENKPEGKDWLKYFQDLIKSGKHDWAEANGAVHEAADERYTATFMLRKIKARRQALLAECHVKKDSELTGYQKGTAEDYNEQIEQYTTDKKEAGEAESQHVRERLRADYQIQTACHGALSEIYSRHYRNLA